MSHLRIWWRFYLSLASFWLLMYALPAMLQGVSSESGQTVYGYLSNFLQFIDFVISLLPDWG